MKAKKLCLLPVVFALIFLFGCNNTGSEKMELSVNELKTEGVGYCYKGADWRIDENEFEEKLGIDLDKLQKTQDSATGKALYMSGQDVVYNGAKFYGTIEFSGGELTSVTFSLSADDSEEAENLFKSLTDECEKLYGGASESSQNSGEVEGMNLESNRFVWNTEKQTDGYYTSLQTMLSSVGNNYTVTIGVAIFKD